MKRSIIFLVATLLIISAGSLTADYLIHYRSAAVSPPETGRLTRSQAQAIAETTCIKGGEALKDGSYNENTKTWWFDANLNATREGCNPACVVSEETGKAEINWRCTGLMPPKAEVPADWVVFKNKKYNYQISHPASSEISLAKLDQVSLVEEDVKQGITYEEKFAELTGEACVSLEYKLGYILISAPANKDYNIVCGRTGIAYPAIHKEQNITINGKVYLAAGEEENGPGETLEFHNEVMVVRLDDGTRIEYGPNNDNKSTFEDYLKIRPELIKIIESYTKATASQ